MRSRSVKQALPRFRSILYSVLVIFVFLPSPSLSQKNPEINGLAKITHYTKEDFEIETQFWTMAEDDEGVIYFGTNWGISILYGQEWISLEIPNGSDVRAIHRTADNRIIVGGYNEFGEVKKDSFGKFYYESLLTSLSNEEVDFGSVWEIVSYNEQLILRSFSRLIIYSNNKSTIIPAKDIFKSMDIIGENILITSNDGVNLLDPETLELKLLVTSKNYKEEDVIKIAPFDNDRSIVFTRQGNSYLFNIITGSFAFNMSHIESTGLDQLFCVTKSQSGFFLLGTINNYIKYYDPKKPGRAYVRTDIQDKTVLNIYESLDGSIWALLNRGVDCIDTSFPGTTIFLDAAIYDTEFFHGRLLIATNQGTYISSNQLDSRPISTPDFELISGLEAQTWNIQLIDDNIFIGHDQGAFYLSDDLKPIYIEGTSGIWKVIPVPGFDDKLLACGYEGLYLLEKINNEFRLVQKVGNFDESSRDIMPGDNPGEFWICHGYKGVFHIRLNQDLTNVISREHFTDKNGLPTTYGINVSSYNGETIFLTDSDHGPYIYSDSLNRFVPHTELETIFSDNRIVTKLTQFKETVWFVRENSMGFYSLSDTDKLNMDLFESLDGTFITSMEHFYPLNSQTIMVGTYTGLYLFRHISPITTKSIPTTITSISYLDKFDSLKSEALYTDELIEWDHDINSLRFTYAAPLLSSKKEVQYRVKLENFDNSWSEWSGNISKEYSFLKPGYYEFKVEAKDNLNLIADMALFRFEITPPWYQTKVARMMMLILILLLLIGVFIRLRRSYNKSLAEQDKLRKVLELELQQVKLEREKELILKDNTILEDNIINQSKELANYTLQLAKNHDLLLEVKDTLNEIKKEARLEKTKDRIRKLARRISTSLDQEEHLQIFDTNFEKVHQSFFNELKTMYPDLTQKELRLCGFVKMNMTNKDIAAVLNISIRGVETARYRLRKHLSLDHDINFVEFLDKLSSDENMD